MNKELINFDKNLRNLTNNYDENLGFNMRKKELVSEKSLNLIKKVKKK